MQCSIAVEQSWHFDEEVLRKYALEKQPVHMSLPSQVLQAESKEEHAMHDPFYAKC